MDLTPQELNDQALAAVEAGENDKAMALALIAGNEIAMTGREFADGLRRQQAQAGAAETRAQARARAAEMAEADAPDEVPEDQGGKKK